MRFAFPNWPWTQSATEATNVDDLLRRYSKQSPERSESTPNLEREFEFVAETNTRGGDAGEEQNNYAPEDESYLVMHISAKESFRLVKDLFRPKTSRDALVCFRRDSVDFCFNGLFHQETLTVRFYKKSDEARFLFETEFAHTPSGVRLDQLVEMALQAVDA